MLEFPREVLLVKQINANNENNEEVIFDIQLAFEGKRFYDMRRWRISESVFSQPIYGMKVTEEGERLKYEKVPIREVTFHPSKNYLNPIPQYAIDQNPMLEQNPDY